MDESVSTAPAADATPTPVVETPAPAPTAAMQDEKCDGCGKGMTPGEPMYCAACADKGEAKAAIDFRARILALTGETSTDAAIGAVVAMRDEAIAAKALRADAFAHAQAARNDRIRANLSAVVQSGRLTVGDLTSALPALLDDANQAAAEKAIAALPDADAANAGKVAAAIGGAVSLSDGEAKRVDTYLARKGKPEIAPTVVEPKREIAEESQRIDPSVAAAIDAAFGHKTEDIDALIKQRAAQP